MGETAIEWTHGQRADGSVIPGYTFNPIWGCAKVSAGCARCYADTLSHRYGYDVWGAWKPRRTFGASYWNQPIKWNREAEKLGEIRRVFCASMGDVFEDHPTVAEERLKLWPLIEATPWLDWLLLTKRPENMVKFAPESWAGGWPVNVIAMTSVENQDAADKRIPWLLEVPAQRRGLSCEPLIGPLDLTGKTVDGVWIDPAYAELDYGLGEIVAAEGWSIHWIIAGGESGHGARPMHPEWARSLRDQAKAANIPFLFKQHGEWIPTTIRNMRALWEHGGKPAWFPCYEDDPRRRALDLDTDVYRVGKHAAGRILDGRTWDEYPEREEVPA